MSDPSFGDYRAGGPLPYGSGQPQPDQPGAHSDELTVVTGPDGQRNSLSPGRSWTIGRAADADVVVTGDHVSRHHLVLEHDRQDWVVRDVSSTGSWHEGTRVEPAGLRVPRGGGLRLNLGDREGPQVLLEGPPANAEPYLPPTANPYAPAGANNYAPAGANNYVPAQAGTKKTKVRRRYKRIAIVLVVLLVLLGIADRVAAHVASTQAMSKIVQQSEGLARRPSVSFGGFPFLTQVAFGKYTDISVGIHDIRPPGSLRIESISGHLEGAHVPLSTVISGNVSKVPVDHVSATVDLRFADLNSFLAHETGHLHLSGRNGAIQVTGTVKQNSHTIKVSGAAKLQVEDGGLTVTPTSIHVTGGGELGDLLGDAGDVLGNVVSVFPSIPVPLPDLPFHLRLTSVHSDNNGVVVSAAADDLVLDPGNT